eukprot:5376076-Amphidinium_carterae.2
MRCSAAAAPDSNADKPSTAYRKQILGNQKNEKMNELLWKGCPCSLQVVFAWSFLVLKVEPLSF